MRQAARAASSSAAGVVGGWVDRVFVSSGPFTPGKEDPKVRGELLSHTFAQLGPQLIEPPHQLHDGRIQARLVRVAVKVDAADHDPGYAYPETHAAVARRVQQSGEVLCLLRIVNDAGFVYRLANLLPRVVDGIGVVEAAGVGVDGGAEYGPRLADRGVVWWRKEAVLEICERKGRSPFGTATSHLLFCKRGKTVICYDLFAGRDMVYWMESLKKKSCDVDAFCVVFQ